MVLCTWQLLGLAGTGWANSCTGCMDRLRKRYSHLLESSFLSEKTAWALSRYLLTTSADYRNAIMLCMNFTFANFASADGITKKKDRNN